MTLSVGPTLLQRQLELAGQNYLCVVEAGAFEQRSALMGCLAQVTLKPSTMVGQVVHLQGIRRFKLEFAWQTAEGLWTRGQVVESLPWQGDYPAPFQPLPAKVEPWWGKISPELYLDACAFHMPLTPQQKQLALDTLCPRQRYEMLSQLHHSQVPPAPSQLCLN